MEQPLYTVLIADDEPMVRQGLRRILPWGELGFTVCGEAADGQSALAFLLRFQPNVVLLDIQMPGLYGTELMAQARERGYTGDFIVLSGYSDFQYAQSAIRSGAVSYLTKPVEEDELQQTLELIRKKLDATRSHRQSFDAYWQKARQADLLDLLLGRAGAAPGELPWPQGGYQVLLCEPFTPGRPCGDIAAWLRGAAGQEYPVEQLFWENIQILLLQGQESMAHCARCLARCRTGAERAPALETAFLACGPAAPTPAELAPAFCQARRLLERRFFCENGQHVLTAGELPAAPLPAPTAAQARQYSDRFLNYLQSFQRRALRDTLQELQHFLQSCGSGAGETRPFLADIFLQIKQHITQAYASLDIPFADNAAILQTINGKEHLYEILQVFSDQFERILAAIGTNSSESILDDVLFYIDHNYAQPLKLETIAKLFGYNSSYLGRIFSQRTGQNFNAYLDLVRVRAARELLRTTPLKVYEIADRVGYTNVDYFHQKFRRIEGCSPAEYRKAK